MKNLNKKVFLVQTDTTVGFLSQSSDSLSQLKQRPNDKPFVSVTSSFKELKKLCRVPKEQASRVRRSKKTSFVYANNRAIRVIKEETHAEFLKPFAWMYSTSANDAGKSFDEGFAFAKSDIIVEEINGFFEGESSSIYRLHRDTRKRLR